MNTESFPEVGPKGWHRSVNGEVVRWSRTFGQGFFGVVRYWQPDGWTGSLVDCEGRAVNGNFSRFATMEEAEAVVLAAWETVPEEDRDKVCWDW